MKRLRIPFKKNSILNYITVFSLLVIVILTVMGGYILRSFYHQIQEDFYQSNALVLSAIENSHENEVQILLDISTQMNLSEDSTDFLLQEQPRKSIPLRLHLNQYRAVNQFFDAIYYYYQSDEYLYNHSTSMSVSYFCEKGYLFNEMTPEEFFLLLHDQHKTMRLLPEQEISGKLIAHYDVFSPSALYLIPIAPDYNSIMLYFIGASHFDAILSPQQAERRNSYIVYGDIIASRGEEEISKEELLPLLKQHSAMQEMIQFEHGEYWVTVTTGASGIQYCTVQSAEILNSKLWKSSWSVLLILLACSIPASVLITWGARKLMRNMRSIHSLLQTKDDNIYSFDSVHSGVQALMEESNKIKVSSSKLQKTRFVRSFIRSDYRTVDAVQRDADDADFSLAFPLFCVVIIGNKYIENQVQLHEMLLRILNSLEDMTGYGINLISNNQTVLLLFGKNYEIILDFCRDIIEKARQMHVDLVMAVSDAHRDLLTGSKAYIEADVAFSSRFLYDQNEPICYQDMNRQDTNELYPDTVKQMLKQFSNAIQFRNKENADRIIDEICDYMQQSHASLITFRFVFDDIQHILVLERKGKEQDLNQFYNVFTLSQCLTIDDFRALLKEATELILSNDTDTVKTLSEMVQKSIDYMKENYQDPNLNMSALAEHLRISPVTLSVEFKSETGISPSDYLTSLRIAQAKTLLQDSDMLVREISLAVGYEDEHVFNRRFKQYTGSTPGQYRTAARS